MCPYPCIIKYIYLFQQIRIFTLSNVRFHSPFRGCIRICGHDKSAPTAADGLPKCCKQPVYSATFTHETRGEHSVRRRGPIHCVCIFTLLNMHIRFLVHVCPHYQIRIFIPPHTYVRSSFCGCLRICKHHKIVLTRTLATRYNTTTYTKCLLSQCKNHTFAM